MNAKRLVSLLVLVVLIFTSCGAKESKGAYSNESLKYLPQLIPYRAGEYWGYCNKDKHIIVQPKYSEAYLLSEGLAAVNLNGKWGYIDEKGNTVIQPKFDMAGNFHEGLAYVRIGNKYGYIDAKGKLVINPMFDGAWDFHNGIAMVSMNIPKVGTKYGYIDKTGKYIVEPKFDYGYDFNGSFAVVMSGQKQGVINKYGKIIVPTKYDQVFIVENTLGLFAVRSGEKYGLFDAKGKMVLSIKYDYIGNFVDGLAPTGLNGKWGYINTKGQVAIPFTLIVRRIFMKGLLRYLSRVTMDILMRKVGLL
jgi:KWG Leptospira.